MLRAASEQAGAGNRSERHRDLQLWIIFPTGALPCLGPAVVEHIFALAVGLEIGRRRRNEVSTLVFDQDRRWGPAGPRPDAPRIFQRGKESVAEKRIGP